jgi:hypothetical protein
MGFFLNPTVDVSSTMSPIPNSFYHNDHLNQSVVPVDPNSNEDNSYSSDETLAEIQKNAAGKH